MRVVTFDGCLYISEFCAIAGSKVLQFTCNGEAVSDILVLLSIHIVLMIVVHFQVWAYHLDEGGEEQ